MLSEAHELGWIEWTQIQGVSHGRLDRDERSSPATDESAQSAG
jgi:hypothetical protein